MDETESEVRARVARYWSRGQRDVIAVFTLIRGWHVVNINDPERRPVQKTLPPDDISDGG